MVGVAGQKRVPDELLRNWRVPVTRVRHQRAIADYLDRETTRIDALVERKQELVDRLEERRRALYDRLTVPVALGGVADAGRPD